MVPIQGDFATTPTLLRTFANILETFGVVKTGGRGTTAIKWDATKHHRNPGLKVRTKQHIWIHPHMYTMKLNPTSVPFYYLVKRFTLQNSALSYKTKLEIGI